MNKSETCLLPECSLPAIYDYDLQGYCNGAHAIMHARDSKIITALQGLAGHYSDIARDDNRTDQNDEMRMSAFFERVVMDLATGALFNPLYRNGVPISEICRHGLLGYGCRACARNIGRRDAFMEIRDGLGSEIQKALDEANETVSDDVQEDAMARARNLAELNNVLNKIQFGEQHG